MTGLLERAELVDALDAQLARAAAGEGRVVLVEGPAGIGKSQLLAVARQRAERSMRVLTARGSELESEFAFGVVRQLFEAELAPPERRQALLSGAAAPAAVVFGAPHADGRHGASASFAVLHGLFWLMLDIAQERPLLLAVDDLDWSDRPSLMFLAYLARRLERQQIVLLAGLRETAAGGDGALLGEIAGSPAALSIRPRPLSEAAVAALAEERLGATPEPPFTAVCHAATGGNPLLLSQLLTALRAKGVAPDAAHAAHVGEIGPRAVSRTVLLRLGRLPPAAGAVARAIAVLGDGAGLTAVAALAGVDVARAADATRALALAELLRPELPLGFVHPLVRDAVYHDASPAERALEHGRAAALLRAGGAPAEQVAAQLLHTPPSGERWVAELLWEAGRAAIRSGAPDSAAAYLRRALDDLPAGRDRGALLLELGTAEALTSGPAAARHLARAREELPEPAGRAAAAALLGRTLLFTGAPEDAAAIARDAARELPDGLDDLRMQLEALELVTAWFGAGDPRRLSCLRARRRDPPGGPGARMLAAVAAWEAVGSDGTAADCAALALAALADDRLLAADPALLAFPAILSLVVADRPEVGEVFRRGLAEAHGSGSLLSAASTHLWHGFWQLRCGDLAVAAESLRAAEQQLTLWGHAGAAIVLSRCLLAEVARERGGGPGADRLLDGLGTTDPGASTTAWWLATRARLLVDAGRPAEAVAAADALAAHCAAVPDPARLWWRSLKAAALDRLDRRAEAIALAREELGVARAFGAPSSLGRTLRVLGALERAAGVDTLREAVAVLDDSTARLERAKAHAALGGALRRARRPTEAREPLRRALELAATCGAERLVERIRSELRAAGARPRRAMLSGVAALTPSERRVAGLAAAGRTNRAIAQELFVTPKTIEVHLSNAYRKLGIGSRRELADALAAPDVP
ncbi:AAA family ATPase [Conexibacter arvalis]|uniref:DNA-binding NarL/FixJ family response regulator n=1 Tax=Conexibacter arvalis TaxID=912552 RepID=A0A840IEC0_9ACTN|nr:DNA-binding NarL/FixJ family response regulator [Conexibacter arvalis]